MFCVFTRRGSRSTVRNVFRVTTFLLTLAVLSLPRMSFPGESAAITAPPLEFSLLDTSGVPHVARARPERSALVVVFLATECPIANGYIPELNRQFAATAGVRRPCRFFRRDFRPGDDAGRGGEARSRVQVSSFRVLFDASGQLAEALKPTHTPEAFVIDRDGQLAYRGRIDDLYADLGKKRTEATRHELADADSGRARGPPRGDCTNRTGRLSVRIEPAERSTPRR